MKTENIGVGNICQPVFKFSPLTYFGPLLNFITCSFEKTLKQKLSQKSTGMASEEAVLLKCFKYFDLNNNGTVEPDEFAKACEKIGIMIPSQQVSCDSQVVGCALG